MEKLLQLLNEYQNSYKSKFIFSDYDEKTTSFSLVNSEMCLGAETIISKKFGFIHWLVVNDKTDKDRADNILYEAEMFKQDPHTDFTDRLLMYLAIQDDPTSFLISVLK